MIVKLLAEHHLGFLSFKGGCRGSSESTHVKMPHCWKSHVGLNFFKYVIFQRHQKALFWSKGLSCSIFNIFSGLGMGVKIFIINYIYNKYPRMKKKYDNTHRLWLTLPTDVQYDKKFVRDEVDKVRFSFHKQFL